MVCPGDCINGGGQLVQSDSVRNYVDLKSLRASVLYDERQGQRHALLARKPCLPRCSTMNISNGRAKRRRTACCTRRIRRGDIDGLTLK